LWKQIGLGWFIAGLWWPLLTSAQPSMDVPVAWNACFHEAGIYYGLAPELLIAIAQVESQLDPGAQHSNPDGSWDIGLMQINTRWLPLLQDAGITPESLYKPCTSIWIGAWVLARAVAAHGYTWTSVGAYNAGSRPGAAADRRRAEYAIRVSRHLARRPVGATDGVRGAERLAGTGIAEYPVPDRTATDSGDGSESGH